MESPLEGIFANKGLRKTIFGNKLIVSALRGAGGVLLAAVAWKIGEDIYEAIKKRLKESAAVEQVEPEEGEE